jgi:hypothetical protein
LLYAVKFDCETGFPLLSVLAIVFPDGSGYIIKLDPSRTAFKQSLIAIVFAGIWFESFIFVVATQRFGNDTAKRIDRKRYDARLRDIRITDPALFTDADRFQDSRKDLVYEKVDADWATHLRDAHDEAKHAVEFVRRVEQLLAPSGE